jgi:hypothetical protein
MKHKHRGNQLMIEKVYAFADQAYSAGRTSMSKDEQRARRQAAQLKRERKMAKRAAGVAI